MSPPAGSTSSFPNTLRRRTKSIVRNARKCTDCIGCGRNPEARYQVSVERPIGTISRTASGWFLLTDLETAPIMQSCNDILESARGPRDSPRVSPRDRPRDRSSSKETISVFGSLSSFVKPAEQNYNQQEDTVVITSSPRKADKAPPSPLDVSLIEEYLTENLPPRLSFSTSPPPYHVAVSSPNRGTVKNKTSHHATSVRQDRSVIRTGSVKTALTTNQLHKKYHGADLNASKLTPDSESKPENHRNSCDTTFRDRNQFLDVSQCSRLHNSPQCPHQWTSPLDVPRERTSTQAVGYGRPEHTATRIRNSAYRTQPMVESRSHFPRANDGQSRSITSRQTSNYPVCDDSVYLDDTCHTNPLRNSLQHQVQEQHERLFNDHGNYGRDANDTNYSDTKTYSYAEVGSKRFSSLAQTSRRSSTNDKVPIGGLFNDGRNVNNRPYSVDSSQYSTIKPSDSFLLLDRACSRFEDVKTDPRIPRIGLHGIHNPPNQRTSSLDILSDIRYIHCSPRQLLDSFDADQQRLEKPVSITHLSHVYRDHCPLNHSKTSGDSTYVTTSSCAHSAPIERHFTVQFSSGEHGSYISETRSNSVGGYFSELTTNKTDNFDRLDDVLQTGHQVRNVESYANNVDHSNSTTRSRSSGFFSWNDSESRFQSMSVDASRRQLSNESDSSVFTLEPPPKISNTQPVDDSEVLKLINDYRKVYPHKCDKSRITLSPEERCEKLKREFRLHKERSGYNYTFIENYDVVDNEASPILTVHHDMT